MHNIHHVWKHHHVFPALNYISQNPASTGSQKQGAFQSCILHGDLTHYLNTCDCTWGKDGKITNVLLKQQCHLHLKRLA